MKRRTHPLLTTLAASLVATLAISGAAHAQKGEGPCKQIKEACEKAGFVKGEAKQGKGLWMDCVDPIIQGTTAKKSVLPLPVVDAGVVAACKAKNPKFGEGKVGN